MVSTAVDDDAAGQGGGGQGQEGSGNDDFHENSADYEMSMR